MEEHGTDFTLRVNYNSEDDTLTFDFAQNPAPAIAEEAADEVWVRYDPNTRRVITVDILNFSKRVRDAFGETLTYTERTDPQRLEALSGLPLASEN